MVRMSPLTGAEAARTFRPGPVSVRYLAEEKARFSLRLAQDHLAAAETAFGLSIPTRIGDRSSEGAKEALCLGPDEWTLALPDAERESVRAAFAACYDAAPHGLVEIGDREVSIMVEGERSLELMSALCPRDLSKIPEGACRRTVFEGVSVVLTVMGPGRYRLDVWRSFAPHLWTLLNHVNEEMGIGL